VAHWIVPVKPVPVTPVPAATLVLLRDRSIGGFEVLLIRRHSASKFAAGDFVFPGGKIEATDGSDGAGVIRETFEEVGILLACARTAGSRGGRPTLRGLSARVPARSPRVLEMLRAERLTPATDRLVYFAHWITPETQPLRFDTRFFAAATPRTDAVADAHEITEVRWLAPRAALDSNARASCHCVIPP